MQTPSNHWLPLTEYALRSGMSISTLRRKIKSNTIEYKMEEGRYLIRSDDLLDEKPAAGFVSSDDSQSAARLPSARPAPSVAAPLAAVSAPTPPPTNMPAPPARDSGFFVQEIEALREEVRQMQDDNLLRWKALEARVSGLAKRLEFFAEQMAETKMLIKIFEEKLDHRG